MRSRSHTRQPRGPVQKHAQTKLRSAWVFGEPKLASLARGERSMTGTSARGSARSLAPFGCRALFRQPKAAAVQHNAQTLRTPKHESHYHYRRGCSFNTTLLVYNSTSKQDYTTHRNRTTQSVVDMARQPPHHQSVPRGERLSGRCARALRFAVGLVKLHVAAPLRSAFVGCVDWGILLDDDFFCLHKVNVLCVNVISQHQLCEMVTSLSFENVSVKRRLDAVDARRRGARGCARWRRGARARARPGNAEIVTHPHSSA